MYRWDRIRGEMDEMINRVKANATTLNMIGWIAINPILNMILEPDWVDIARCSAPEKLKKKPPRCSYRGVGRVCSTISNSVMKTKDECHR